MKSKLLKIIFVMYLVFIFDVVVLKFFGSVSRFHEEINFIKSIHKDGYGLSLQPYTTLKIALHAFFKNPTSISSVNFIANIVLFIPMGILMPSVMRKPSILLTIAISILINVGIETIQYFACLGIADIDDVILNTTGCLIGCLIYIIINVKGSGESLR